MAGEGETTELWCSFVKVRATLVNGQTEWTLAG